MDATTIVEARRGQRDAQATLLREMQDSWYRLALGLLGDAERARDATQEAALRFLARLHEFRGDSQLRTWAFGIALNVVREMRRQRPCMSDEDARRLSIARRSPPEPHEAAIIVEERQRLLVVLETLPERQREAVVLRFFEELSVDETACVMACAPGTIKACVHQALRTMRKRLISPGHEGVAR